MRSHWVLRTCGPTGVAYKPWRKADNRERLDGANGFLLVANLDSLFDNGLISFDDEGQMLTSKKLKKKNHEKLGIGGTIRRSLSAEHKRYLDYHRKHIFQIE